MSQPEKSMLDLDRLDAQLLEDLQQQLGDGLITQAEADDLARRIAGQPAGEPPCG